MNEQKPSRSRFWALISHIMCCTGKLVVHRSDRFLSASLLGCSSHLVEAIDCSTRVQVISFARISGMASRNCNVSDDWCDLPPQTGIDHFPVLPHHGLAALPSCSPSSFASLSTALCCSNSNRLGSCLVCTGKRAGVFPDNGNGRPAS